MVKRVDEDEDKMSMNEFLYFDGPWDECFWSCTFFLMKLIDGPFRSLCSYECKFEIILSI